MLTVTETPLMFRQKLSTKYKKNLFGMETNQKLNTPLYATNIKMVA